MKKAQSSITAFASCDLDIILYGTFCDPLSHTNSLTQKTRKSIRPEVYFSCTDGSRGQRSPVLTSSPLHAKVTRIPLKQ